MFIAKCRCLLKTLSDCSPTGGHVWNTRTATKIIVDGRTREHGAATVEVASGSQWMLLAVSAGQAHIFRVAQVATAANA